MKKKIIGIFICMLLIATALPCVSGNIIEQETKVEEAGKMYESTYGNILFSDDFNDNQKDNEKWNEFFNDGTWWERNGRTEFRLYETTHNSREGLESIPFSVLLSDFNIITISVDWITLIESSPYQWVGRPVIYVTDKTNFIRILYARAYDHTRVEDSTGTYYILEFNKPEGTWNNQIQISSKGYNVKMDNVETGWIGKSIFSDNPTLTVRIYLVLAGDYPYMYYIAGFDNVVVWEEHLTQSNPPNQPSIEGSSSGNIKTSFTYTASTTDPDGDNIYYMFDWDDGTCSGWLGPYESGATCSKSHIWESQGSYSIKVKAKDYPYGAESVWSEPLTVTISRNRAWFRFFDIFPILQRIINYIL